MEFFERLYRGVGAEHYVAGRLFSAGFEAFKMPADFGFDLMVTNQREQSIGPHRKAGLLELPFAVQVKSRTLKWSDFEPTSTGRDEAQVSISVKEEDLELMIDTKSSFLIVVMFVRGDAGGFDDRTIHCWFASSP